MRMCECKRLNASYNLHSGKLYEAVLFVTVDVIKIHRSQSAVLKFNAITD